MYVIKGTRYMSIDEFSAWIQVSRRTIFTWLKLEPPLPAIKVGPARGPGSMVLIPEKDGNNWVQYHAPAPPPGRKRRFYLE